MDILADDNVTFDGDATALRDHCLHRQPGKELEKESLRVRKVQLEPEFEQLKTSLEADFKLQEEDLLHSVEARNKELDERASAIAQWEQHAKVLEAVEDELKAERDRSEELQRLLEISDVKLEEKDQEVEILGIQLNERREENRVLQSELDRTTTDLKSLQNEVARLKKQVALSTGRRDAWAPHSRSAKPTRMPSSQRKEFKIFQKSFFPERPSFRRSNSFATADTSQQNDARVATRKRDREFVPVNDASRRSHNGSSRFAPYQRPTNPMADKSNKRSGDGWAAKEARPARELTSFAVSRDKEHNHGPMNATHPVRPTPDTAIPANTEQESVAPQTAIKRTFSQAAIDSYVRYFREGLDKGMQFDDIAKFLEGCRGKDTVEQLVPIIRKALV
ncbi:hypothetical protein AAVH_29337 [Aphelenchoides avenae]|nr:hypothetical protein AAVH_29337 [Aphelenchus avenae]